MKSIEKISVIHKDKLNGAHYFQTLLEEAYRQNLLRDTDIEAIQVACIALLKHKVDRYNMSDSSSIRIEAAQNIMTSNLYTIGLWLKTYPHADDALQAIRELPVSELYAKGAKRIDIKRKTAKHFHALVLRNKMLTQNHAYNATIIDGIQGFFKIYNPEFDAHEIHITADYPLCNPVKELVGIEFIVKYLEAIYYENMFCENFTADAIHHLLSGYDKNYQELIFNIFEQVLTAALGCKLAGSNSLGLNIPEDAVVHLTKALAGKAEHAIGGIIQDAYEKLKGELTVKSASMDQYVKLCLPAIATNIFNAITLGTLDKVLVKPAYPEFDRKLYFSFGDKMDDEQYRKIVDEVMLCAYASDKAAIIKRDIHALADLEDIIFDAELEGEEILAVLKGLEPAEIAAMVKRHPLVSAIGAIDLSEQEQEFRECLHAFIIALPQAEQALLAKIALIIEDDHL